MAETAANPPRTPRPVWRLPMSDEPEGLEPAPDPWRHQRALRGRAAMGQWSGDSPGSPYSRGSRPPPKGATYTPPGQTTTALQAEQTVGTYMRGVRDALAPALAAYGASANANSAASARANDEEAIAALTSARRKIEALTLLEPLRTADGDIRAAMDALAGGL